MSGFIDAWLSKRFRVAGQTRLNQSKILIFIFGQGYVYVALILISFMAGINYANNLILGFCFLIAAILWMSFYITFKQLHELDIEIIYPEVGQLEQHVGLQLHITQPHAALRYLKIQADGLTQTLAVQQSQQVLQLYFYPQQRGYFEFPTIKIYSSYPFGLVRAWSYLYLSQGVWIAPKVDHLTQLSQQHAHSNSDELEEFRELRHFVDGDAIQLVSWKHAAQGQGLLVKVFDHQQDQQHIHIDYVHIAAANHEQKLSIMMAMLERCEQCQCGYRLSLPKAQLPFGQGQQQGIMARQLLAQA